MMNRLFVELLMEPAELARYHFFKSLLVIIMIFHFAIYFHELNRFRI